MKCEICGETTFKPHSISVEGSTMRVCEKCSRYGTILRSYVPKKRREYNEFNETTLEVVEGYASLIHQKREQLGMTQEELGKGINEPESVIKRLETRKMRPSEALARKLEKVLRLSLLVAAEKNKISQSKISSEEVTLGDLVKVKKRKH